MGTPQKMGALQKMGVPQKVSALHEVDAPQKMVVPQKMDAPQKVGACLCWCFTAQSTQWGHVEHGQFT